VLALLVSLLISHERYNVIVLALLLSASVLVLGEYVHLHALTAFSKHADFAAWFTCMGAGYALARSAEFARRLYVKLPVIAMALAAAVALGVHYSGTGILPPPQENRVDVLLKPYLELRSGRYLLGGKLDTEMIYSGHMNVAWYQFVDDNYVKYPIPGRGGDSHWQASGPVCTQLQPGCMYLGGAAGYRAAIQAHWFSVISMVGARSPLDGAIEHAAERTGGYVLLTTAGGAPTWVYAPAYRNLRA
jgi:hypothetical protein